VWLEGEMLNSVKSSLGDTQAQAEAAAVQAFKAAGDGSVGSGPC
jgi:hypothetical protein